MFEHQPVDFGQTKLPRKDIDGNRYYQVGDMLLPSVTTVMSILTEDAIADWKAKVGEEEAARKAHQASTQGNIVHELCEQYILNQKPDRFKRSPVHLELFDSIQPVLNQRVGRIYGVEQRMYSETLGVAGTADLLADFDGIPSVIDYKTSGRPKEKEWCEHYFQQCACYSFAAFERAKLHLPQIVLIIVNTTDFEPQVFVERARDWLEPAMDTIKKFHEKVATS